MFAFILMNVDVITPLLFFSLTTDPSVHIGLCHVVPSYSCHFSSCEQNVVGMVVLTEVVIGS